MKRSDVLLYALFLWAAVILAALGFCAVDWLWGIATAAVVLGCAYVLRRRCKKKDGDTLR